LAGLTVALVLAACGGVDRPATGGDGSVPPRDAGSVRTDAGPPFDAGPARDAGSTSTDAGMTVPVDAGPTPTACREPAAAGLCGTRGIVRLLAQLPAGALPATGTLMANMNHFRLGSATTGGVPHITGARGPTVTLAPGGAAEIQFDLCTAGEMWSEENCEFSSLVWVDTNGNSTVDPGEPAGRVTMDVNCHVTTQPCTPVTLGCTTGASCAVFTDPGVCACGTSCADVGGAGRIVTCS